MNYQPAIAAVRAAYGTPHRPVPAHRRPTRWTRVRAWLTRSLWNLR